MQKFISLIVVVLMIVGLTGCSGGVSQEEYDKVVAERDALLKQIEEAEETPIVGEAKPASRSEEAPKASPGKFDEETVVSQLEVKEFKYSNRFFNYAFLTIKNNSEYDVSIAANVKFYDEAGNLIGAKSASQEAVESGYDTILCFMPDEKFAKMEYELEVSEEKYYECVISDLSYEGTEAKNKVILSVTNNGEETARFVEAIVLFFNGDTVVGFSRNYTTDDDAELKPGKTISKEMDCSETFDSYQVFFSGSR